MGSFANTLFTILLGWLQGAVSAVWSAFTTENGKSFFAWVGENWLPIAGILCVIGLAADLCVYLFRWKPFRVWKSFLSGTGYPETGEQYAPVRNAPEERSPRPVRAADKQGPVRKEKTGKQNEPDLSQWEEKTEDSPQPETTGEDYPATVTNAGYVVPADSPYRRPVPPAMNTEPEGRQAEDTDRIQREGNSGRLVRRRRRRISVSELFSDPEEEMREFDAPQSLIDSRRAYREPVYPSGWKKGENSQR